MQVAIWNFIWEQEAQCLSDVSAIWSKSNRCFRFAPHSQMLCMLCAMSFIVMCNLFLLPLQIREHKLKYFTEFWNILDVFVLLVSYVCIGFSVYRTVKVNVMLDDLLKNPEEYADFEYLAFWQSQFNNAVAVAVFFAWIKVRMQSYFFRIRFF